MTVGGDVSGRNGKAAHPVAEHQGQGVVLLAAVAAVARIVVFPIQGVSSAM